MSQLILSSTVFASQSSVLLFLQLPTACGPDGSDSVAGRSDGPGAAWWTGAAKDLKRCGDHTAISPHTQGQTLSVLCNCLTVSALRNVQATKNCLRSLFWSLRNANSPDCTLLFRGQMQCCWLHNTHFQRCIEQLSEASLVH